MVISVIIGTLAALFLVGVLFINQPGFGRLPTGERLERIKRSPHYKNGKFQNLRPTELMTSNKGRFQIMWEFLFSDKKKVYPDRKIAAIRTDLRRLPKNEDVFVWFGHSSYLLKLSGKRILVDPVFGAASPVSFINKPFKGTDIYGAADLPEIDYLVITHDHWDHLEYKTIKQLKSRIHQVICPLGVGEHFECWGFDKEKIVELDWYEEASLDAGFFIHCLPSRHFSGRGLTSDQALWASFLIQTPSLNVYIGGDGGYDSHFEEIGEQYSDIDLAILENGQYNEEWRYIHTMPVYLGRIARELKAKQIITVHHSKYALAKHPWDEPLQNEIRAAKEDSLDLIIPVIGQVVGLIANGSLFTCTSRAWYPGQSPNE